MNGRGASGVHWSFWAIGIVTLIWNILGSLNFFLQMDADIVASMPETHRAITESRPAWATAAFALAVLGGMLGCVLLLRRKATAYYLFVVSLIGVIVTMIHTLGVSRSSVDFGPFEVVMMVVMPLVVTAFLIWYAKWSEGKGWIR